MLEDVKAEVVGDGEKSPKISVIVPVYKVEKYLPECIESVLAQTFTDFELILVDDGSPDNSGKICDDYAKKDPRIRVFHKENGGVVSARMCGLKESLGAYIIFLDGDDTWTKTALTGLISVAELENADFVRGGFFYENEKRELYKVVTPILQGCFDIGKLLSRPFRTLLDYTDMCVGGNLYRRSVALNAAGDVGEVCINHSEDGLFAMAAFLHSRRVAFLKDPFYYYLQREGSAVHQFNPNVVWAQEQFCEAVEKILHHSEMLASSRILQILGEHQVAGVTYVFSMLQRAPSFEKRITLLKELRRSRIFRDSSLRANLGFRKKVAFILLRNSALLQIYVVVRNFCKL